MLEAALSIFDALLGAVEALEHLLLAFCAEFLTAIESLFDEFSNVLYSIRLPPMTAPDHPPQSPPVLW